TGIWTNLQRGTWVEFTRPSHEVTRARLTWISPNKGVYLFTNPMAESAALSVSPEALAEQMRLGHARLLGDAALVDRAVDSMLARLRTCAPSAISFGRPGTSFSSESSSFSNASTRGHGTAQPARAQAASSHGRSTG